MDAVDLQILRVGLQKDAEVLALAAKTARDRWNEDSQGRLAAAGYELNRGYNILEKAFERVCDCFENHFEKRGNYHEKLIERMELTLIGIRPAFLPADPALRHSVREVKGFRHVFRHAYDLELESERVENVIQHAEAVAAAFPDWCETFARNCQSMHGL